jgi:CBS domain-containing protein
MRTVRDLLVQKGRAVWTISPEAEVRDALKTMAEKKIGALVVVSDEKVVGVFSERDNARKVVLKGRDSLSTPVRDVMTSEVYRVKEDTTTDECMALMTEKHIRHLPVLEGDRLVGLVSIGDIVKAVITEQKITIEHLQDYIMGRYL